jgi:hypothetical protein
MKNNDMVFTGSSIEFNTNNAWGFGGGIGYVRRYGTAFFRHLPPKKFERFWTADKKEIDRHEFIDSFQVTV